MALPASDMLDKIENVVGQLPSPNSLKDTVTSEVGSLEKKVIRAIESTMTNIASEITGMV